MTIRVFRKEVSLSLIHILKTLVEEECTKFNVDAENAGLEKNGSTFNVIPGKTGLKVDVDTSVDLILDYISNEWDHGTGQLELAVEVDEPKGTAEQLGRVKDLLGSFSTSFPNSSSDRVTNVSSGAKHINASVCLLYTSGDGNRTHVSSLEG